MSKKATGNPKDLEELSAEVQRRFLEFGDGGHIFKEEGAFGDTENRLEEEWWSIP